MDCYKIHLIQVKKDVILQNDVVFPFPLDTSPSQVGLSPRFFKMPMKW